MNKSIFSLTILILLIIFLRPENQLFSQTPGLNFRSLNMRNGLSYDDVRCIYQDKEGFMWFGNEGGADKFDGRDFQNYQKFIRDKALNTLQSTNRIYDDSYNGMWFINDTNGVVLMDKRSNTFTRFTVDPEDPGSISGKYARDILEDSHGNLWITTLDGGLNLFERKDSSFTHFQHDSSTSSGIGSNKLTSIAEDRNGMIWLGSPDGLLIRFDPVTFKFDNIRIKEPDAITWQEINDPALYVDANNNIWYGSRHELFRYDAKSGFVEYLPLKLAKGVQSAFITSLLELEPGVMLITTFNTGLFVYNIKTRKLVQYSYNPAYPFGINSNRLSQAYRSVDGVIWISSYDNGVNIYSKYALRFPMLTNLVNAQYLENSNHAVYSLLETPDGKVIIGTQNNGLFSYNPTDNSVIRILPQLAGFSIYDMRMDRSGMIWICTWRNGLYRFNWQNKNFERITELDSGKPFKFNAVKTCHDAKNRQWFASLKQGLMMFDRNSKALNYYFNKPGDEHSLSDNNVFRIFEDSNGRIWIGTSNGINVYNERTNSFTRIKLHDADGKQISNLLISDIFEDSRKRLWFGTGNSLYLYDPGKESFTGYNHRIKGNSIAIHKILEDDSHKLWLGTNSGISRFDPATGLFMDYGATDGIYYLSTSPNAGMKSTDGYMYIGTAKGVCIFNPLNITDDTLIPPVYITGLSVNDVPVNIHGMDFNGTSPVQTDIIRLNYNQSTLTFRFAALNYNNPETNQYRYQLEGYDKTWIKAGNSYHAYYTNLHHGKYIFRVIASNSHGYWNTVGSKVVIIIRPPFWKTLWFNILVVLLIVSAVLYRLQSTRRKRKMLQNMVNERTRDLNDANAALIEQREELLQQHEEITSQNERLSQMSDEILQQNAELEQHRSHLQQMVEERTKELEIALHKAEESDRLKSAFLANMSHEIRTPMNAIVGFAHLLKDDELSEAEKTEFIEVINANSEILLVLIDDILDLSLIEANQLTTRKEVFSLNDMLDHLYSSFSLMNRKDHLAIRINNELHDLNLKIDSDRIRIKQVLSNLMNNAYKFTEKGFIELGLQRKNRNLLFYVKDTGIGIEKHEIESIFERFRKSESKSNTMYRGTGLGLAISRALARLLDGNLSAESTLGRGSVFYFSLPWSVVSREENLIKSAAVKRDNQKLTGKDILIVEDEQANYLYVKKMLGKMDVNIHWAENGLEAIKLASSGINFHLILMDIKMPVMDGFEATKVIKANNPLQIVIALTAYARPEDRVHFMRAGFDDYLAKPIRPNDFIDVIRRYML